MAEETSQRGSAPRAGGGHWLDTNSLRNWQPSPRRTSSLPLSDRNLSSILRVAITAAKFMRSTKSYTLRSTSSSTCQLGRRWNPLIESRREKAKAAVLRADRALAHEPQVERACPYQ